jgi:hypothetical protein
MPRRSGFSTVIVLRTAFLCGKSEGLSILRQ